MRVNCKSCCHYYITWDPRHPYGCRGFKIKSKENPAQLVLRNSGKQCQLFEVKNRLKKEHYEG